jgi:hypothetical protein
MPHTAIAVLQTPWDCKWTRFTYRRSRTPDDPVDPYLWLCVREPDAPRRVDERDCEDCPHWQMDDVDPQDW